MDNQLGRLQRRFMASGDLDDELAYLHELLRVGGPLHWDSYARLAILDWASSQAYLGRRIAQGRGLFAWPGSPWDSL